MGIYILVLCIYIDVNAFSQPYFYVCISHIDKGKSHMREFLFATGSFFCLSFINEAWTKDIN